ncbi:LANO_0F06700g1_1 [Lachancea nothofagi CBS 11611]|uniref:Telomerase reverse transcriptase n=1 Tax=Lachancea nothofagi CBS 11611 TaxID=1266666 RepID=A0A1G4K8R2_9SACH|nr:LANO_0F06700g1_1 [Lachancea nothofagi CBS 11611]
MKCLKDFIAQNLVENENVGWLLNFSGEASSAGEFRCAILDIFVSPNPEQFENLALPGGEHSSVVDECIKFLRINTGFSNVLTYGYKIAKNSDVASTLHCESSNLNVTNLKSGIWTTVHKILGTECFVNLIINFTIYDCRNGICRQTVGPVQERGQINGLLPVLVGATTIGNSEFLYRNRGVCKISSIMPCSLTILWYQIFGTDKNNSDGIPTECRVILRQILSRVIHNHRRLKYRFILDALCPYKDFKSSYSNMEPQTSIKSIVKFLTVIIEKLFPLSFFGSRHNKSVLMSKISFILKLKLHGRLPISFWIKGLRIKDIEWLGSQSKIDYRELRARQDLLERIIEWFFGHLLSSVIVTFFYCSELSGSPNLLFFRFDVWAQMTQPFLKAYFERYLTLNEKCQGHVCNTEFAHGYLRLIPKKAKTQFRVIFVPLKCREQEKANAELGYMRSVLKPAGCILSYVSSKRKISPDVPSKKLSSPSEISSAICDFKARLLKRYGEIPYLFFIKFDIENCYDSIPRSRAREVINQQLSIYSDFYVRSQSFYDSEKGSFKQISSVNGDLKIKKHGIAIDNVRTVYLTKKDVIEILDKEMENSSIIYGEHCLLRNSGIFQGTALSAHIVDFLYDDLVESHQAFRNEQGAESLILRLADDFLVISTSKLYIEKIETHVWKGFETYNAFSNERKVLSNLNCTDNKSLRFCAIDLDMGTLEVMKR